MEKRKAWTTEEVKLLEEYYKSGKSQKEIATLLNRTEGSINTKCYKMKLGQKYMRSNNPSFKAEYQNAEWLYQKIAIEGKTLKEISKETGYSVRVLQKWAYEKGNNDNKHYKDLAILTDEQRMIILSGTLGDGHIAERDMCYIEVHAIDQKDYLFWKYDKLKNLCSKEPSFIPAKYHTFSGEVNYLCNPQYRFSTRRLNCLLSIKNMTIVDKIKELDELGVALHFLDDASCKQNRYWQICVAGWAEYEIDSYISKLKEYNIVLNKIKDKRYLNATKDSSDIITEMILKYLPHDLDIIQHKIFGKEKIYV